MRIRLTRELKIERLHVEKLAVTHRDQIAGDFNSILSLPAIRSSRDDVSGSVVDR